MQTKALKPMMRIVIDPGSVEAGLRKNCVKKGLKTLVLERGKNWEHVSKISYDEPRIPWDMELRGLVSWLQEQKEKASNPAVRTGFL